MVGHKRAICAAMERAVLAEDDVALGRGVSALALMDLLQQAGRLVQAGQRHRIDQLATCNSDLLVLKDKECHMKC